MVSQTPTAHIMIERNILKKAACLAAMTPAVTAGAQVKDVSTMLSSSGTALTSIADPLLNVLSIIVGMIGAVMVIPTVAKYIKGEPTSADAFVKLGGGLIVAFVILQIIRLIAF